MEMRALGAGGLEVSVLSFGTMTFGSGEGQFEAVGGTHGAAARRQVDMCLDAGVNLFDTADIYSDGQSEEVLGQALGARRSGVLIATKAFGRTGPGADDVGLGRAHLLAACEASLRRLGTDWIDLYQVHGFDALVPVDETLRALDDLVRAGKVRQLGCSNHAGWQLLKTLGVAAAHGWQPYVAQQIQYSLLMRDAEHELLPAGVDQGVGALIWSPLAQGYLSGKFQLSNTSQEAGAGDGQASRLGATGGLRSWDTERGRAVVALLAEIAAGRPGVTPSQVALNWVRARPGVTSIILGARRDAQLADNLAAASWTLDAGEIERLDRASQTREPYPNSHQRRYGAGRNPQLFPRHRAAG